LKTFKLLLLRISC